MGFYEDDRIRHKNATINEALNQYDELKAKFWSDSDIVNYATSCLEKNPDNKAAYALLKIAVTKSKGPDSQASHNQD